VVARDHSGTFKFSRSEEIEGTTIPELAEAMAMRRASVLSRDHGFTHVAFASDCLTLVQKMSTPAKGWSMVDSMVGDIKTLAAEFSVCLFKHVGRS
jgi:hypothetical protein